MVFSGLDIAMAGLLTLASGAPQPANAISCEQLKQVRVSVNPSSERVEYDFTKSRNELQALEIDTISPFAEGKVTHVNGAMSGTIQIETQVQYQTETYRQLGMVCVYVDTLQVTIHYDPTIYITRDYKPGTCEHNAVMEHEKKHLKVDELMITKYAESIDRALRNDIRKEGFRFGPFTTKETPQFLEDLKTHYVDLVEQEQKKLSAQRLKRQQSIDTLAEYERVAAICR